MAEDPIATLPLAEIRRLCEEAGVRELAVFGSALDGGLEGARDVDFLVEFEADVWEPWMGHFTSLREELARLVQRDVDLVDRRAIERSRNWIRQRAILESARTVFSVA